MKVLNVILSILILLLAAVSAVSSYMLFVKRGQMVKGWEKMATAINQAATEMDRGSGTKVGVELTAASLGHKEYESLDGRLAKLKQQATQLVAERDALAAAVRRAGEIIGMGNLPAEASFREMVSYNTSKDEVLNGLVDFIATDAHNEKERGPRIGRCADWLEKRLGEAERKRLLTGNPAAVLADREL